MLCYFPASFSLVSSSFIIFIYPWRTLSVLGICYLFFYHCFLTASALLSLYRLAASDSRADCSLLQTVVFDLCSPFSTGF